MTDQEINNENGWVNGFGRFRILCGYTGYNPKENAFMPRFHHVTFYAKDERVRNFMMVFSRAPKGMIIADQYCEIFDKTVFSPN